MRGAAAAAAACAKGGRRTCQEMYEREDVFQIEKSSRYLLAPSGAPLVPRRFANDGGLAIT